MPDVSLLPPEPSVPLAVLLSPSRWHGLSTGSDTEAALHVEAQSHTLTGAVQGQLETPRSRRVPGLRRLRTSFGHPLLTGHSPLGALVMAQDRVGTTQAPSVAGMPSALPPSSCLGTSASRRRSAISPNPARAGLH